MGGLEFAGNGKMDVGDGMMPNEKSAGFSSGGPVVFPKGMEAGMTSDGKIINVEGSVPAGSGVTFTKGNDW